MGREALIALINNAALLITLAVVYGLFYARSSPSRQFSSQVISGLFLGMITLAVMLNSWQLAPGVVFDTRSVVLGLIGLYFGLVPSLIAASMSIAMRMFMGGGGTLAGISSIISSVSVGLLWRHFLKERRTRHSIVELYLFGILVHVFMLLCMLLLPSPSRETFYAVAALPVMLIYPAATTVVGWAMTAQSARRRGEIAERVLAATSERLATIVKNSPIAIVSLDLEYRVTSWNEAAEEIFGWKSSEVIGKPLPYIPENMREEYARMNEETLRGLSIYGKRFVSIRKDGSEVVVKLFSAPIRNDKGDLEGMLGILEDVTAQHKAEAALKESELRFRRLYMNMNAGIAIYKVTNLGEDVVFLDMNPAGCKITGVTKEEILGRSVRGVFPKVVELGLYDTMIEVWKTGRSKHHPVMNYRDGKLDLRVENFVYRNRPDEIVAVFEDVTKRELTLQELERRVWYRTKELEEVNKELEAFTYSMAHDLKAHLRAINGFSKIISDRYSELIPEEGTRYLGFILKAGEDMSELITGLLEYSKVGRSPLNLEIHSLKEIVDECVSTLSSRIEEEYASVQTGSEMPNVYVDRTLMKRAVINLLQNSLTYHKPEERAVVKIYSERRGEWVHLIVEDNGIGISQKFHERIFNIFQRLHSSEDFPGSGIGLAIVKKSITLMGGDVSVQSVPGEGAKFIVKIKEARL